MGSLRPLTSQVDFFKELCRAAVATKIAVTRIAPLNAVRTRAIAAGKQKVSAH